MDAKRELVLDLHQRRFRNIDIFRKLKNIGVNERFIERTLKRYRETGTVKIQKKVGRKRSVRNVRLIKTIRERIRRKPARSARKMALDLGVSTSSVHRVLKKDLKVKAYKKRRTHGLTALNKGERVKRTKLILKRHADAEILFSDEKLFILQESFNPQNDRIYAVSRYEIPVEQITVQRFQSPQSVMVWGGICKRDKLPLFFIEKGAKIDSNYYLKHVLQDHMLPYAQQLFGNDLWVFQQDTAPAHKANSVQYWLSKNLPNFIPKELWPASSPDLNPMDFSIWGYMLSQLTNLKRMNMEKFKQLLIKIWDSIPDEVVRAACEAFPKRLKEVKKAGGERIEIYR